MARQIATRLRDLVIKHVGKTKMLKERDDVRESLVKRKLIAVNGAQIFRKGRIQQSVGGFVRDNVVGKAGENQTARQLRSLSSGDGRKITKEQRLFRGAVIGVRSAKRMRIDAQLANETIPLSGRLLFVAADVG